MKLRKQELAPDPRTKRVASGEPPRLWVQEPGVWTVFSPDGELIESAGSLLPDGSPKDPMRQQTTTAATTTRFESEGPGEPKFTRDNTFDAKGKLVEEVAYLDGKLFSRHIQKHGAIGRVIEDITYDAAGKVVSHQSETLDEYGRVTESINIDNGRLTQHIRDTFDDKSDDHDYTALTARGFYDEHGLFRELRLRNGEISSWWQRPNCGDPCDKRFHHAVRLNFPFDRVVDYAFEPDGSLITTIEYHKGRYGNIDNDSVEVLKDNGGAVIEKIAYRYVRDEHGNWIERVTSILETATGKMIDVRRDTRELTYY